MFVVPGLDLGNHVPLVIKDVNHLLKCVVQLNIGVVETGEFVNSIRHPHDVEAEGERNPVCLCQRS